MPDTEQTIQSFGGIKDDEDPKQIPVNFFASTVNFRYPKAGLLGYDMILMPTQVNWLGADTIDGMFEYKYLDTNNVLQTDNIAVAGGNIYHNVLGSYTAHAVTFTPTTTNTVNRTTHGFSNGDRVYFTVSGTGALPASLTVNTIYYVVNKNTNDFQVALTLNGSPIAFATAGTSPTQNVVGTPPILKTGLTAGRTSFVTFQDKLFIANGKNYIQIYYGSLGLVAEMGSPAAVVVTSAGNVDVGTHYYAMTYVTAGGEEVLGSVSNTITTSAGHQQVTLSLPIGYSGTITRNIYRTLVGGTTLKLLYSVPDNTTLTYTDNIADATITGAATIPASNNELPKPYFMTVANQKLYAGKVDKYPTQIFVTDTNLEVIDFASFIDLANYGDDNTAISALGFDYNKVVAGTGRNLIFIDPATGDIVRTRGYVGIKDGYSMKLIPSFGDFPGGLFFISSLNDVRLIQGTQAAAVFQTIDNIRTDNWAQNIRGSLYTDLGAYSNIASNFYDNRYILTIDNIKYVFDIRTKGWTTEHIKSTTYESKPRCFAVMGDKLYNGQSDGWIELEYQTVKYRGEDVSATLGSAYLNVSRLFKWFKKLVLWFKTSLTSSTNISVVLDSNENYPITATMPLYGGVFNPVYFNSTYFLTSGSGDSDYRVVNVTNPCRWAKFTLTCTSGNISFMQWGMVGQPLKNVEEMGE